MNSNHALEDLRTGGKRAIADALTALDQPVWDTATVELCDAAFQAASGHVIGLTGPPGVGKSSLINALIRASRKQGKSVAVVAVDPSSNFTGGALLGDRTRFDVDPEDTGIFVRSLASRGALGGLADIAFPSLVLLRALYDHVFVETVGVGQSEAEIADAVDTVVLCVQPGSGDSLQFMKAGIMEIPDICVVTKSDLGPLASQAASEIEGALSLAAHGGNAVPVVSVSVATGNGIGKLVDAMDAEQTPDNEQRKQQAERWIEAQIRAEFGRRGLISETWSGRPPQKATEITPFSSRESLFRALSAQFDPVD